MPLRNKLDLIPGLLVKVFPKPNKNPLRFFLSIFILGGSVFVVGHYIFNPPPKCTEQQAQTCSCPLW